MSMLYGELAKNGEILELVDCGNNNYMVSINIGNQRNKIPSYTHIRTTKDGISVINNNLGNELSNNFKTSVIIRDPQKGYYIYNLLDGKRVSNYFKEMKFMNYEDSESIYASDTIRNDVGTIFIQLGVLLSYSGEFLSEVMNITTDTFYKGITTEKKYEELKQSIRKQIDSYKKTDVEVYQKLLKRVAK